MIVYGQVCLAATLPAEGFSKWAVFLQLNKLFNILISCTYGKRCTQALFKDMFN
jgi:hypothetical protein